MWKNGNTKFFEGTDGIIAIALLEDRGLLDIDSPIATILPELYESYSIRSPTL
jgi:hypothetical protein